MTAMTVAAAAHHFGRNLDDTWRDVAELLEKARAEDASLVVLPEATLGGYLSDLEGEPDSLPPALHVEGPEVAHLAELAGDLVVCAGYCETDGNERYNSAVCVNAGRVLGNHRKVHQPLGESKHYRRGDRFAAFDTPIGRIGMVICYDKVFPEAARTLALDGATVIAALSAWPASRTNCQQDLAQDRWTTQFDLFDQVRALENQVIWVSANQTGEFGSLQFVGRAKVVSPGGETLAETGTGPGLAVATVDVEGDLAVARRSIFHLSDRRPDSYGNLT